jgi:ABC-type multidrug transport system permease subunit
MTTLFWVFAKDLRLLLRDRAALVFIAIAPVVVISIAGFSLANFYGADPTGQTAYELPVADEDGGALAREIVDRLAEDPSVRVQRVATRAEAEKLVHDKRAGTAIALPPGTEAALDRGERVELILYTDPVKYLERVNVRVRLLEVRDELAERRRRRTVDQLQTQRAALTGRIDELRARLTDLRASVDDLSTLAEAARARLEREIEAEARKVRADVNAQIARERDAVAAELRREVQARAARVRTGVDDYLASLARTREQFETWIGELRRLAGRHAGDIPAPPSFPEPPADLLRMLKEPASIDVPAAPRVELKLPHLELPALEKPALPALALPEIEVPELDAAEASLSVQEVNVTGGPMVINTFDQNVPGFSVTFLLLGMLLGVSLGLLDERDWGTFRRLLATPMPARNILLGKLLSRFCVGLVQMLVLFAVGYVAFGISLGSEPWALLLPIVGIVFAGTAFGLVVAVTASSREAVLPVGSIVIVTMAAVGGCWWPIDLEPRWMRSIALAFPTTWAMDAFNDLMIRRRGLEAALVPTAVMLGYGLIYLGVGLALFRRRIAASS